MTLNAMKKDKNIPTLNVPLRACCCYTCGAGSIETYEKADLGLDPKTLKPSYEYRKYTWYSLDDPDEAEHFENVAWTKKDDCWGQKLIVNDGDSEEITKEEYEGNK
mgnify:CR=1 FL=1